MEEPWRMLVDLLEGYGGTRVRGRDRKHQVMRGGVRAGMVGVVGCGDGQAYSMYGNHQRLREREGGMKELKLITTLVCR